MVRRSPLSANSTQLRLLVVVLVSSHLLLGTCHGAAAFWASLPRRPYHSHDTTTTKTTFPTKYYMVQSPLSDEEIFARMQQQQQQQPEEEKAEPLSSPLLFDDDMLADMQQALLALEKRVQEGPGALSKLDIDMLESQMTKIRNEMKTNQHKKPEPPTQSTETTPPNNNNPSTAASPAAVPPQSTTAAVAPITAPVEVPETTNTNTVGAAPPVIDMDTPPDEGETYQAGKSGMGQAADTVNTYIIEGMEEMTAEEYQKALQDTVIMRQRQRKASGVTGNRSTWDYLNSISGDDGSGVMKNENKKPWKPKSGDDEKGTEEKDGN